MAELFHRYKVAELESKPTLAVGQAADLKVDKGHIRVWLSRCSVEDGEPYNNKVSVEMLINGRWVTVDEYQAY